MPRVNSSAAQASGIVNVPAGQTSGIFNVTTFAVSANTSVTIMAFYDTTRSANLTVTPGTAPPPTPTPSATLAAPSLVSPAADARFAPGTNITFDWSDLSGAANYTLQIDDQNTFSSPIVNQNVTASQFSSSTLPTLTMWWRPRANNASGNDGTWSTARRFEVKN